jgi:NAD(P)-dependent dehydrogenase (short-subunit alcohol dehydrogenase family)
MRALDNRGALVTCSARGIGKGIAARLVRDGATVVVADALADRAEQTAEKIRRAGARRNPFDLM